MHYTFRTLSVVVGLLCAALGPVYAALPTIVLRPTRLAILNDGRDSTEIIADVRDSTGRFVPDGTTVTFLTSQGRFLGGGTSGTANTRTGTARIRLVGNVKGTANITASVSGGGFQRCDVLFTDDPADTFQGNAFAVVDGTGSVIYSAGHNTVQASARSVEQADRKLPGAYLLFRNVELWADSLQFDCRANTVRANGNVMLRRGASRLNCRRLSYNLTKGEGLAIMEIDKLIRPVKISGPDLKTEVQAAGIAPKFFEFADFSESQLLITARQVLVFPGEKLQFKRPQFYQDGVKLFALPFYSLAMNSQELFSDQFLNVGSGGLGVNIPYYYDMSPVSTGLFRVRYGERGGRFTGATRPGWAVDLTQAYNSLSGGSQRYTGEFGFNGVNRSDWGFRWTHSHEFSPLTRGSFFLDVPQHRGLYLSTNLNQQLGPLYAGLNISANRSLRGFSASGEQGDLYLETAPRKVGKTGYMMSIGGNAGMSHNKSGTFVTKSTYEGVQARFYSQPVRLDKVTTVSNNLSVGNVWTSFGRGGRAVIASVNATRTLSQSATLNMTYDYTGTPTLLADLGRHRVGLSLFANGGNKWSLFVYNSTLIDANNSSLIGDFSYAVAPRWRFSLGATLQKFASAHYRDFLIGIGRSIGPRELALSYSTLEHRIFFDIQAARF